MYVWVFAACVCTHSTLARYVLRPFPQDPLAVGDEAGEKMAVSFAAILSLYTEAGPTMTRLIAIRVYCQWNLPTKNKMLNRM